MNVLLHFCPGRAAAVLVMAIVGTGLAASEDIGGPAAGEELKAPLFDGFEGEFALDWQPVREDTTHTSLAKHAGKLTITTQRGSIHGDEKRDRFGEGTQAKNIHVIRNPLANGDFVATTCIESFHPTTFFQQAGLIVYDDDDNYLKWGMEWSSNTRTNRSFTVLQETEQQTQFNWIEAPADSERFWLRLIKRGKKYQHAYSLDGEQFHVVGERTWGNGTPKCVGLLAKNGGNPDAPEIDICFDSFELRSLNEAEKTQAAEEQKLEGTWQLIAREANGEPMRKPTVSSFAFAAGRLTVTEGTGEEAEQLQFAYTIDATCEPKQIILTPQGDRKERELLRMAYSVDGEKLIVCFDPQPGAMAPEALTTQPGDGRVLVTLRANLIRRLNGHTGPATCVAFSPDGKSAVSGSGWPKGDRMIRLWDVETGQEIRRIDMTSQPDSPTAHGPQEVPGEVCSLAFAPDGRHALCSGAGGFVTLWDIETGKLVREFKGHTASVYGVAISGAGRLALSCGRDGTVRVWDVASGNELRRLKGHSGWIRSVAISPDGQQALTGGYDKTMRLWDIHTGRQLREFDGHESWVWSVTFSPDGRRALSADGRAMRLWDLEDGRDLHRFDESPFSVTGVAFSPDGRRVISGAYDRSVRLWDVETGREVHRLVGHRDWVWSVAFSPDGQYALSAGGGQRIDQKYAPGEDFTIRLWRLP